MSEQTDKDGRLWRICPSCGQSFYLTAVACATFKARALELPRRCWSCRQLRRDLREAGILDEKER